MPDPTRLVRAPRPHSFLIVLAITGAIATGCNRSAPSAEEKAPPATVKWEGPAQLVLEEWTELLVTTIPLPDRVARVTAPIEGRVQFGKTHKVLGDRQSLGTHTMAFIIRLSGTKKQLLFGHYPLISRTARRAESRAPCIHPVQAEVCSPAK